MLAFKLSLKKVLSLYELCYFIQSKAKVKYHAKAEHFQCSRWLKEKMPLDPGTNSDLPILKRKRIFVGSILPLMKNTVKSMTYLWM